MRRMALAIPMLALASLCAVAAPSVTVEYLGHSCFTITGSTGKVIMIDPYASTVPYPGLPQRADIVLMTHEHIDHCPKCYRESGRYTGNPVEVYLLDKAGRCQEKRYPASWAITDSFTTQAVEGTHETESGNGVGWVCMYSFVVDGIRFAHLGDLGQPLSAEQIAALGDVQVLFVPVGGLATIDAAEAVAVIKSLPSLKLAIPMHYFVDRLCPWPFDTVDVFLNLAKANWEVRRLAGTSKITLTAETLPTETEVWALDYKR